MSSLLAAIHVTKRYPGGVVALNDVSLRVGAGETVALIGESGSGKTTLLKLFNRLLTPTSGTVEVGGRDVAGHDPIELRRAMGYVQQDGGLLPHWTVHRNIALVPTLLGWSADRRDARVGELLDLVGLPRELASRYPRELSGGQRQRVAIARALAADPDVVLLDEPFGALDAITRIDLQDAFRELARTLNKTMVLVTHDLAEAFHLADRVAVMHGGTLAAVGTRAELAASDVTYVRTLLERGLRAGATS